jgi:hypothetical protein
MTAFSQLPEAGAEFKAMTIMIKTPVGFHPIAPAWVPGSSVMR